MKTFLFVATALFVTAAFFAVAVLVVASSGLDDETKVWLFSEGRPVEMLFGGRVVCFRRRCRLFRKNFPAIRLAVAAAFLRHA